MKKYFVLSLLGLWILFQASPPLCASDLSTILNAYDTRNQSRIFYRPVSKSIFYGRDETGPLELKLEVIPDAKFENPQMTPTLPRTPNNVLDYVMSKLSRELLDEPEPFAPPAFHILNQFSSHAPSSLNFFANKEIHAKVKAYIKAIDQFCEKKEDAFGKFLQSNFEKIFVFRVTSTPAKDERAFIFTIQGHKESLVDPGSIDQKSTSGKLIKTKFLSHISEIKSTQHFKLDSSDFIKNALTEWGLELKRALERGEHRPRHQ